MDLLKNRRAQSKEPCFQGQAEKSSAKKKQDQEAGLVHTQATSSWINQTVLDDAGENLLDSSRSVWCCWM
eukprot:1158747-Pelagomonas_calceolata.AAC.14